MTKKKAGRKKKIALAEFRAWLEGVEELQPANWSPTAEQWQLIRDKIDCIISDEPQPVQYNRPPSQESYPAIRPPMQNGQGMIPPVPVEQTLLPLDESGQPIPVPLVGNSTRPVVPPNNALLQPKAGQHGTLVTKTPEIDTSP